MRSGSEGESLVAQSGKGCGRKSGDPEVGPAGSGTCAMGIGGKINRPKTVRGGKPGVGGEGESRLHFRFRSR